MRRSTPFAQGRRGIAVVLIVATTFGPSPAAGEDADRDERCVRVGARLAGSVDLTLQTRSTGKDKVKGRSTADLLLEVCHALTWDDSVGVTEDDRVDTTTFVPTDDPLAADAGACVGVHIVVDGPVTGVARVFLVADGHARLQGETRAQVNEVPIELRHDLRADSDEEITATACLSSDGTSSAV